MIGWVALAAMGMAGGEPSARTYRLDGDAATDETPVHAGQTYDGDHGYEPGDGHSFSVAVPEGNWLVTVTLGSTSRPARTTIKAEARRLMIDRLATRRGETQVRRFTVNVRTPALAPPPPHAPGGSAVRLKPAEIGGRNWDDRLTLEFLGDPAVRTVRIEPADVPTLYLAGDSTVTDQAAEPAASWGQMLPAFTDAGLGIANHAESGETLKSFLTGLRLDKLLSHMRAGDFLFIQFGHNDQKTQWPQTYADARFTYPAYLRAYIAEARRRGAQPVLVTPPERRHFGPDGKIRPTLADHVAAMEQVAKEEAVPLIDLNRYSRDLYETLGEEVAATLFNDGGADRTHHNNAGAWLLARFVASEAKRRVPGLHARLHPDAGLDTAAAMSRANTIEPSAAHDTRRPDGN